MAKDGRSTPLVQRGYRPLSTRRSCRIQTRFDPITRRATQAVRESRIEPAAGRAGGFTLPDEAP